MDLNKYKDNKVETGADLKILDPHDKETDIVITVLGKDSKKYQQMSIKRQKELIKSMGKRGSIEKIDPEKELELNVRELAALTIDWKNVSEGKTKLECNEENAYKVYSDYAFIKEQVQAFINDRANFF